MCIIKKESWGYGGTNYDTELEAVKAALTDLGMRFQNEYRGKPLEGMLALGMEITPLRDRYIALTDPDAGGGEGTSEKVGGDPSDGHRRPRKSRRLAIRDTFSDLESTNPLKRAAVRFMDREGYLDPRAFWTRANAAQFDELEIILEMKR